MMLSRIVNAIKGRMPDGKYIVPTLFPPPPLYIIIENVTDICYRMHSIISPLPVCYHSDGVVPLRIHLPHLPPLESTRASRWLVIHPLWMYTQLLGSSKKKNLYMGRGMEVSGSQCGTESGVSREISQLRGARTPPIIPTPLWGRLRSAPAVRYAKGY